MNIISSNINTIIALVVLLGAALFTLGRRIEMGRSQWHDLELFERYGVLFAAILAAPAVIWFSYPRHTVIYMFNLFFHGLTFWAGVWWGAEGVLKIARFRKQTAP